jgi:hypothetical protein
LPRPVPSCGLPVVGTARWAAAERAWRASAVYETAPRPLRFRAWRTARARHVERARRGVAPCPRAAARVALFWVRALV